MQAHLRRVPLHDYTRLPERTLLHVLGCELPGVAIVRHHDGVDHLPDRQAGPYTLALRGVHVGPADPRAVL
jgi:hypothetical protein